MSGAKLGRTFLLKISDGAAAFTSLVGVTSKSLSINGERIDTTIPDAVNPEGPLWRTSLDGVKSIDFSGDGKMVPGVPLSVLVGVAMSQTMTEEFQVIIPGLGTFEGLFSIKLDFGDDGSVTFALTGESDGPVTFTAAA